MESLRWRFSKGTRDDKRARPSDPGLRREGEGGWWRGPGHDAGDGAGVDVDDVDGDGDGDDDDDDTEDTTWVRSQCLHRRQRLQPMVRLFRAQCLLMALSLFQFIAADPQTQFTIRRHTNGKFVCRHDGPSD